MEGKKGSCPAESVLFKHFPKTPVHIYWPQISHMVNELQGKFEKYSLLF